VKGHKITDKANVEAAAATMGEADRVTPHSTFEAAVNDAEHALGAGLEVATLVPDPGPVVPVDPTPLPDPIPAAVEPPPAPVDRAPPTVNVPPAPANDQP
jgi:hypothetical protein